MPTGPRAFFWSAIGSAMLAGFFAGMSFSSGVHGGVFASMALVGVATFGALVTQLVSD